jgi:hypothetical protein
MLFCSFSNRNPLTIAAHDLLSIARVDRAYLHPEGRCHALDGGQLTDPGKFDGIPNDGGSR